MKNKTDNEHPFRFFLGTQKAGSTYFYNLLLSHPDVSLSRYSEINYFLHNFDQGLDWYLSGFKKRQNKIDISPKYFMFGRQAAPRIKEYANKYLPDKTLLFVLMLRNPIDYLYSHFQMQILQDKSGNLKKERGDFVNFLQNNSGYLHRAKYAKILKEVWFKYFSPQQFKIIIFEEFVKNKEATMDEILLFWKLPVIKLSTATISQNKMLRFKFLIKWRNMVAKNQRLKNTLKQSKIFNGLYNNLLTIRSAQKISDTERRAVKKMVYTDVKELAKLLNKDLSVWSDFSDK